MSDARNLGETQIFHVSAHASAEIVHVGCAKPRRNANFAFDGRTLHRQARAIGGFLEEVLGHGWTAGIARNLAPVVQTCVFGGSLARNARLLTGAFSPQSRAHFGGFHPIAFCVVGARDGDALASDYVTGARFCDRRSSARLRIELWRKSRAKRSFC